VALINCGENVESAVEEMDNRILKETKCHSETIEVPLMESVFKALIQSGLMYPPFWFSMLASKKAMLILLKGNLRTFYLKKGLVISLSSHTRFSHWIPQLAIWRDMLKLFDRLSDPSHRLIHRISHPSEEQTLVELNLCGSFDPGAWLLSLQSSIL